MIRGYGLLSGGRGCGGGVNLFCWARKNCLVVLHIISLIIYSPFRAYVMQNGSTALHCAAVEGHADVVDVLVDHGAVVEAKDKVCINIFWLIFYSRQSIAGFFIHYYYCYYLSLELPSGTK